MLMLKLIEMHAIYRVRTFIKVVFESESTEEYKIQETLLEMLSNKTNPYRSKNPVMDWEKSCKSYANNFL